MNMVILMSILLIIKDRITLVEDI